MVAVRQVTRVWFEEHPGWSDAEQQKIAAALDQSKVALFGSRTLPPKLVAPKLKFGYRYLCAEESCKGHTGQLLDWELTAFQRHHRGDLESLKSAISNRFRDMMFDEKRDTSFYMGNFENPKKRDKFSVLGVHYPERRLTHTDTALFELDGDQLA